MILQIIGKVSVNFSGLFGLGPGTNVPDGRVYSVFKGLVDINTSPNPPRISRFPLIHHSLYCKVYQSLSFREFVFKRVLVKDEMEPAWLYIGNVFIRYFFSLYFTSSKYSEVQFNLSIYF